MAIDSNAATASPHPSPHRDRVGLWILFIGLCAGPTAWVLQLLINYALASSTCYPQDALRNGIVPTWEGGWWVLITINVAAIAAALAGAAVSRRSWHATQHERAGHSHHLLETGEGRTRFIALVGAIAGFGFAAATVADTIALFVVPQCAG